jgi:transcriptional regulator with XRE-family HTH domain
LKKLAQNTLSKFGAVIRRTRLSQAVSQEQLADRAGIHRTYVGDVERGRRNISLINMQKLAIGLAVPLSSLIEEMEHSSRMIKVRRQ